MFLHLSIMDGLKWWSVIHICTTRERQRVGKNTISQFSPLVGTLYPTSYVINDLHQSFSLHSSLFKEKHSLQYIAQKSVLVLHSVAILLSPAPAVWNQFAWNPNKKYCFNRLQQVGFLGLMLANEACPVGYFCWSFNCTF